MKTKIIHKLIIGNIIILLSALIMLSILHSHLLSNYIFSNKERELIATGEEINHLMVDYINGVTDEETITYVLNAVDSFLDARVNLVDLDGLIILESRMRRRGMQNRRIEISLESFEKIKSGEVISYQNEHPRYEEPMLSVAIPVIVNNEINQVNSEVIGALFLHAPVSMITETVEEVRNFVFLAGLFALLLAAFLGYFLSKKISQPLVLMSKATKRMTKGDFTQKIEVKTEDEIGTLAKSFNKLSTSLSNNINSLKEEKSKFESTVRSMSEGVIGVDSKGRIFLINNAAQKMLELKENELPIGENYKDIKEISFLKRIIDRVFYGENNIKEKKYINDEKVFSVHASKIIDHKDQESNGSVILFHDVSEAEKLEKLRREFIASASHELRTPLTTITGFLEAVSDGTVKNEPEKSRYIELIKDETSRLNRLVNDLLNLSKYESGKIEISYKEINLNKIAFNIIRRLKPKANENKIKIISLIDDNIPLAYADPDKIEQVILNLLDNSIRFTPEGGKIEINTIEEKEKIVVSISDTGIGIPEKELTKIWDRFHKVDSSRKRDSGGTGLGLSIVKRIIESHGEKIWVKSIEGEGATFYFTLRKLKEY